MNDSSNVSITTPKNEKGSMTMKYLDSKTKANSFFSNDNIKQNQKSSNTTIIKSLKNTFVTKPQKNTTSLPIKTIAKPVIQRPISNIFSPRKPNMSINSDSAYAANKTSKSISKNKRISNIQNDFEPKFKITTPVARKAAQLQTSVEKTTKPVIVSTNTSTSTSTTRGQLRKETTTTNNSISTFNTSNLKPSDRRLTDIYSKNNPQVIKVIKQHMTNDIRDIDNLNQLSHLNNSTQNTPKKSITNKSTISHSMVTSPREAKIKNLKSTLFNIDKVNYNTYIIRIYNLYLT